MNKKSNKSYIKAAVSLLLLLVLLLTGCVKKLDWTSDTGINALQVEHNLERYKTVSRVTLTPSPSPTTALTSTTTPTEAVTFTPTPTATPTTAPTFTPVPTSTPTTAPTLTPTPAGMTENSPAFTGKALMVLDGTTGEVIYSLNGYDQIYPASTIKLLTALTALELGNMSDIITTKSSVLAKVDDDVYTYGLVGGSSYSLETLMNMLLISSYGDAAVTIADGLAGSVDAFVVRMNAMAVELGLENTHVDNPTGLDIGNNFNDIYSTAYDIAKLAFYASQNYVIKDIVAKASYDVPTSGNTIGKTIKSTNLFLTKSSDYNSKYYTVTGMKTGDTDAAGSCFVATATGTDGRKIILAYFGGVQKTTEFKEVKEWLDYIFLNY